MANGWRGCRSLRGVLAAVAVVCVFMAATPRSRAGEEAGPDLDEVLGALRALVGHSAWAVNSVRTQPSDLQELPEGYQEGRMFSAALGEHLSIVAGVIYQFTDSAHARSFVASERAEMKAQIKEMRAMGFPASALTLRNGAGSGNALEGFRFRSRLTIEPGSEMTTDRQSFVLGRVVVVLGVLGTPRLTRSEQDRALDYAAAFLRDPVAAGKLPKPVPSSFDGMGRILRIRIEGPDGKLIPRARVVVRVATEDGFRSCRIPMYEGTGVLPMPEEGKAQVFVLGAARADGKPLSLRPTGPVIVDSGQSEIVVRLKPGLIIAGRVRTPDGLPARGVRVEARLGPDGQTAVPAGPRTPDPLEVWSSVVPDPYTSTRSLADGTFELLGLIEGPYRLRFNRGDDAASPEEPLVTAGSIDLEILLRPAAPVQLTILDPQGRPVPNATVAVHAVGRQSARVQTGKRGVAILEGLDATSGYTLSVFRPFPRDDLLTIRREGWTPADATMRFEAGWTLRGVVKDGQGRPVRAWVYLRDGTGRQSEPDGAFEFEELPKRGLQIAAAALGFDERPLDLDSAYRRVAPTKKRVVLTIREEWLMVRVTGPKGSPVPRASLKISLLGASGGVLRSSNQNVVSGIWRGKHPNRPFAVEVYQSESVNGRALSFAPAQRGGLGPKDGRVTLRLSRGMSIGGRVLDAEGKPVGDLEVCALPAASTSVNSEEPLWARAHARARTGPDGTFTLIGLGAGRYELRLDVPDSFAVPKPVQVIAGARDVKIVLPAR